VSTRIIVGLQPVREAIRTHGDRLSRVLVLEGSSVEASPQLEALARFATDHGAHVERPARSELDRVARGVLHQGAVAFAPELSVTPLHDVPLDDRALVVALDEIQDPQNFGAVIRSAVAMKASAIVWPEHRSAPLSPSTFRASAGAIEHATLCRVTSLVPALEGLRQRGVAIIGLDMNGPTSIDQVDLTGPVAIVVGAEGKGLRKTVKNACDTLAHLPMPGPIASLNASVAVAIALYECVRQRGPR
jgi:23S rRNA (guanosine2251-2'-O)-methyltransferase